MRASKTCLRISEMLGFLRPDKLVEQRAGPDRNRIRGAIMATASTATIPASVKDCLFCGATYHWPAGLHRNQWVRRKFCSHVCSNASRHTPESRAARFWDKADKTPGHGPAGECWEWKAALQKKTGYGLFGEMRTGRLAHRVSYEIEHGSIPDGIFVCHRCDNRRCVRPSHLFLGTHQDNMDDMKSKGRAPFMPGEQGPGCRLTQEQVESILSDTRSHGELARAFGVNRNTIRNIRRGKTWTGQRKNPGG